MNQEQIESILKTVLGGTSGPSLEKIVRDGLPPGMKMAIMGDIHHAMNEFIRLGRVETVTALDIAVELMHRSFIESEDKDGNTTPGGYEQRSKIFDLYGHALIHKIDILEEKAEQPRGDHDLLQAVLLVIARTLKSPIEDAEKVEHMRTAFTPEIMAKLEAMSRG